MGLLLFGFIFYQNKQYQKQAAYQAQLDSIAAVEQFRADSIAAVEAAALRQARGLDESVVTDGTVLEPAAQNSTLPTERSSHFRTTSSRSLSTPGGRSPGPPGLRITRPTAERTCISSNLRTASLPCRSMPVRWSILRNSASMSPRRPIRPS